MNELPSIMLSNLLVAAIIAVPALAAGRWSRRPALVHGLWLLFFIKLVTPPFVPIEVAWLTQAPETRTNQMGDERTNSSIVNDNTVRTQASDNDRQNLEPPSDPAVASDSGGAQPGSIPPEKETLIASLPDIIVAADANSGSASPERATFPWVEVVFGAWLAGTLCWFGFAAVRLLRFRTQLRHAQAAPADLQREASFLADELAVSCPQILVLPGRLSPMLWVLGRTPRLLVPAELLGRLDWQQRQAMLVHELAHWRRRDHWVRWLELVALGLYWWCPLVWWARRQMQEAEEECCDAWVVWLMPGAARGYALALVETLDFMANARIALPPVASGIGHVRLLQRRLTMIMRGTTPRALTWGGVLAILGLGALLLPLMPSWAQTPRPAVVPDNGDIVELAQIELPRPGALAQAEPAQPPGQPGGDPFAQKREELNRAMADIQRLQADLDRARADLERRSQEVRQRSAELKQMMERFKQAPATPPAAPQPATPPAVERKGPAPKGAKGEGGGFGGFAGAPPGGFGGGGAGNFGGGAGIGGGGGFGGGGFGGGAGPMADMDKRLREVERKIDMLIQMMKPGAGRPGVPGGAGAGALPPAAGQYPPVPPQPAPVGVPAVRPPQGLAPTTPVEPAQPTEPQTLPTRRATPQANNAPVASEAR